MNTIIARPKIGKIDYAGTLFQYDYGQRVVFEGVTLPGSYEVHFANSENGDSVTMLGDSTGVDIPDALLTTGSPVHLWIYLHTGENDGETVYHCVINVTKRTKPTNQEPTPVQQDIITQAIAVLQEAIEHTAVIDDTAGIGDKNKVWSADKTQSYVDNLILGLDSAEGVRF